MPSIHSAKSRVVFFRGAKPRSLAGGASKKTRAAYKRALAEHKSLGRKIEKPLWVEQSEACLHDANRNNQMLGWSIGGYLEKNGVPIDALVKHRLSKDALFFSKMVGDARAKKLLFLFRGYFAQEGKLIGVLRKSNFSEADALLISKHAARLLDISHKMRFASAFLEQELKGTDDAQYYSAYKANFGIVKASLLPLLKRTPRMFVHRFGLTMDAFFEEYSKTPFFDREGHKVLPIFKVSQIWPLKVDKNGLRGALNNLIQDAINHTPGTPIHVESGLSNGYVSIKVFNQGKAIPEERLPFIGHDAYWSKGQGRLRGQGKISVRLFCEDHGGKFKVYNMQQGGKHFGPCLEMLIPRA